MINGLETDGDDLEKYYWKLFIEDTFPSYENFWLKFVAPLTNRPINVHFKTNAELIKINKSESDICIAQLNYSVIKHLSRTFDFLKALRTAGLGEQLGLLTEGFARLVGAQDNAFELMERFKNPTAYRPFLEEDGKKARGVWQKNNDYPLQTIRDYRNSLLHGRLMPGIIDVNRLCLPEMGKVVQYLDWRIITDQANNPGLNKNDFISVLTILESAWIETVDYLENNWKGL